MSKILITGANGQLGRALQETAPKDVQLLIADRNVLDITDPDSVAHYFKKYQPAGVINAAAYTAVDRAESEVEKAEAVNAIGPGNIASAAADSGAHVVHVSTDFVFDGSNGAPYQPDDAVNPVNVYGRTKAKGEHAVLSTPNVRAVVLRTAWVYSTTGSNFMTTMLRLMKEKDTLTIVTDQFGTPTHALGLAEACWTAQLRDLRGIYHWTDAGVASWYDFAVAIYEEARRIGVLTRDVRILPISASQFPTAAQRPVNSVLDKSSSLDALQVEPVHWQKCLSRVLRDLADDVCRVSV